jgi:RNA polymerase sigma factor (sigma-70 family)
MPIQPDRPILCPVVPRSGRVPAGIDSALSTIARAEARRSPDARNALFLAYESRLRRQAGYLWRRFYRDTTLDREDLEQETFLVFCDLLGSWSGNGSFSAYLLGSMPWRLRDTARRAIGSRDAVENEMSPDSLADTLPGFGTLLAELEDLVVQLVPEDMTLVRLSLLEGRPTAEVARIVGLKPRSVRRRLQRARAVLHAAWVETRKQTLN